MKFTWDPGYQASKKKTSAERQQSREEFTKPKRTKVTATTITEEEPTDPDDPSESYVWTPSLSYVNRCASVIAKAFVPAETYIPEEDDLIAEIAAHVESYPESSCSMEKYIPRSPLS